MCDTCCYYNGKRPDNDLCPLCRMRICLEDKDPLYLYRGQEHHLECLLKSWVQEMIQDMKSKDRKVVWGAIRRLHRVTGSLQSHVGMKTTYCPDCRQLREVR